MASAAEVYRDHPTESEIADVLGQRLTMAVATHNRDGSVHLAYVIFLLDRGRLLFETSSVTRKARNLEGDPRISVLLQGTAASSGRHLMASTEGTARILRDTEAADALHRLRAKYIKPEALPDLARAWDRFDDIAVEITPGRWRSWTGGVFHAESQQELDVPYDDIWIED
jgi:PPOX class probable F420-dependent enzyme